MIAQEAIHDSGEPEMNLTANEKSYRNIRQKLESGSLAPGDQLITRTLAKEIGVSLTPVREAINRLATEGLIQHTPGAGAVVKQLDIEELDELYVLRDAIESCAAGIASETMTPVDLDELAELLQSQEKIAVEISKSKRQVATKKQISEWLQIEEQFHQTIIRCSRNSLLAKVNGDHRALVKIFESQIKHSAILTSDVANATVDGKRQLLEVFRRRDSQAAKQLMSQQIQTGRRTVISHLRKEGLQ